MTVGEHCNRDVVIIGGDESIKIAAEPMRMRHVGDLVMIEERKSNLVSVGIVTDRGLVVEVMTTGITLH